MTVPTPMATGIEIKTQSRSVKRMIKERASQISPIQPICRPLSAISLACEHHAISVDKTWSTQRCTGKISYEVAAARETAEI